MTGRQTAGHSVVLSVFWIALYLALVLAPLFVILLGAVPPGFGFVWDRSMAWGSRASPCWACSSS